MNAKTISDFVNQQSDLTEKQKDDLYNTLINWFVDNLGSAK